MEWKKVLAGTLTAAMVLSAVPVTGMAAFAAETTADDMETVSSYKAINQEILKENAKDNSHAQGAYDSELNVNKDGAAANAFDGNDNTLWHENYDNSGSGSQARPSASNPIWIQTGFGVDESGSNQAYTIGKLTYRGRPDSYANHSGTKGLWSTRIERYAILVANVKNGSPTESDWAVAKSGIMPSDLSVGNAVSELTFPAVEATHVRLVCLSTYGNDNYVCAGEINIYQVEDKNVTPAKWNNLEALSKQPENGSVTIVAPGSAKADDRNAEVSDENNSQNESASVVAKKLSGKPRKITLLATPDEGYSFSGWKDENGNVISREAAFEVDTNTYYEEYVPVFVTSDYQKISVLPDGYANTTDQDNPSNIRTNSQRYPIAWTNDGPAWWAFDQSSDDRVWHARYTDSSYPTVNEENNGVANVNGIPAADNKLWVEVSFPETQNVKRITVQPNKKANNSTRPKDYEILAANTEGTASDEDFAVIAKGTFADTTDIKTVELPANVNLTHIRVQFSSGYVHGNTGHLSIANIVLYDDKGNTSVAQVVDIPEVISDDETMGTVTTSTGKILESVSNDITMTATANEGYHFVKWVIRDNDTDEVYERSDARITETVTNNTRYTYRAMFAKDAEVTVSLDNTYLTMNVGDAAQTLTASISGTDNTEVSWVSENDEVATVENGVVTAIGAGETTITATSAADDSKSASCTVVVNAAPDKTTLTALMAEAMQKVNDDTGVKYPQAAKDAVIAAYKVALKAKTAEQIKAAEDTLRDALDNMEPLYKVKINTDWLNDAEVTLTAENGEYASEDGTEIYVPLVDKVTVTASAKDGDTVFTGWQMTVDGVTKTVCTSTSYTFYVIGDTKLEPVYSEFEEAEEVNLFCSSSYRTGTLSFIGKRAVPASYKVVEHGIVITDAKGWEKYKNNTEAFVKGATRTRKSVAKGKANNGTYEAKLKCGKNEKWYGRSYVTYTDGNAVYTLYSEIAEYPHQ